MTGRNLLLTLLGVYFLRSAAVDLSRAVDILNESGEKLEVYWLRPGSGEAVRYTDLENGAKIEINSFINHTFMLREGPTSDACDSKGEDCHVNYITVTEDRQQSKCLGSS
jgi:hypothetical protein